MDFVAVQIKFLSFLAYVIRIYQVGDLMDRMSHSSGVQYYLNYSLLYCTLPVCGVWYHGNHSLLYYTLPVCGVRYYGNHSPPYRKL